MKGGLFVLHAGSDVVAGEFGGMREVEDVVLCPTALDYI